MEMNQQYLDMFIEESKEHLQNCSDLLLDLEKNPGDLSIVNEIFRSAHTLKGMAATMGFEDLADLTHKMENVLDAIRNEKITVDSNLLDVVFESVDHLEAMITDIANGGDGKRDVSGIVSKLKDIEAGKSIPSSTPTEQEVAADVAVEETAPGRYLIYDEYDITVLKQSKEQGFNTYEISVSLRPDCLLKAARVFMVFQVLEKSGEVIKSFPTVEKLEEEQFDQNFQVAFITKDSPEEIKKKISKVSEIENVVVVPLTDAMVKEASKEEIASKEQQQKELEKSSPVPKQEKKEVAAKKDSSASKQSAHSKTIRVSIERLDILMNLFEELVIDRGRLQSIAADVKQSELTETVERMSRTMGDLQNIVLTMRMIPIETVFNRFPKMVRSLSRELNKKIRLEIIGAETELDRTVIDEIGDPLVHLIRNSVDHGIESPEARRA
ncbi:MAG: chemotaxis protein CheA, partial [Bacilli bacterium]